MCEALKRAHLRRAGDRPPSATSGTVRARSSATPEALAPEVAARVRAALRAWRSERAAAERKPAFVFLHDRTLEALATGAPASMAALARVNGIGPAKLESYGDDLLAVISAAVDGGSN